MKKLDQYILKQFLLPFSATFFVVLFLLVMQFLWASVKEIAGKGLDIFIIIELLFYVAITLVTLAVPLAVLLSSIMSFGNFGEKYELAAIKASGIPISRVFRPLIILMIFLSIGMYFFSEYIFPYANYKRLNLQSNMIRKHASLKLRPGVFDTSIPGYYMRIKNKVKKGDIEILHDVFIQNYSDFNEDQQTLIAKQGKLLPSANPNFLILELEDGVSYKDEIKGKGNSALEKQPTNFTEFSKMVRYIDISSMVSFNKDSVLRDDHYLMLNSRQLYRNIDSLKALKEKELDNQSKTNYSKINSAENKEIIDSLLVNKEIKITSLFQGIEKSKIDILNSAIGRSKNNYQQFIGQDKRINYREKLIGKHQITLYKKLSTAIACLVLFFIGAPLGSIVRKGGLGLPFVIAVVIFVIYHIIGITGENLVTRGRLDAFIGTWLSSIILLPFGIYLTYKATMDSPLFDLNLYLYSIQSIFRKGKN